LQGSLQIEKKLLDLNILFLLSLGPKTGYELSREIPSFFGTNVSFGTLYPHLHLLEDSGLVHGLWEEKSANMFSRRKKYSLTTDGTIVLRISGETLSEMARKMRFAS